MGRFQGTLPPNFYFDWGPTLLIQALCLLSAPQQNKALNLRRRWVWWRLRLGLSGQCNTCLAVQHGSRQKLKPIEVSVAESIWRCNLDQNVSIHTLNFNTRSSRKQKKQLHSAANGVAAPKNSSTLLEMLKLEWAYDCDINLETVSAKRYSKGYVFKFVLRLYSFWGRFNLWCKKGNLKHCIFWSPFLLQNDNIFSHQFSYTWLNGASNVWTKRRWRRNVDAKS